MYLPPQSPVITSTKMVDFQVRLRRWWMTASPTRRMASIAVGAICFLYILMNLTIKKSTTVHIDSISSLETGTFVLNYVQTGRVITERGMNYVNVTSPLQTSMIYSYSPEVEEFFKEAIYDPFDENIYVGLGPAILDEPDGSILSIQRLWLSNYDILFNKDPTIKTHNTWQENFLYKRKFSANWHPTERGSIMGIPTGSNCHYAYRSDGPMDPRLFRWNDTRYLSFHIWQFDRDQSDIRGRMFMWNYELNQLIKLNVPPDFRKRLQRTEINWIPLVVNNSLYYIYLYDPFRVFKCERNGDCSYAQWPKGEEKYKFDGSQDVLRGGSPFILYKWPYYISIGHSQVCL